MFFPIFPSCMALSDSFSLILMSVNAQYSKSYRMRVWKNWNLMFCMFVCRSFAVLLYECVLAIVCMSGSCIMG